MRGVTATNKGFTLIQTMISLTITSVIVGVAALAFYQSGGVRGLESARMDIEQNHRLSLDRVRSDLSEAIRVSGATATTMPGISRNPNSVRSSGESVDSLIVRIPLFGQFTLTANYTSGRTFTTDRTNENARTFDLFSQALTTAGPRKVETIMISNMANTNIVKLESATLSNVSGVTRLTLIWADAPQNPANLSGDFVTNSLVTIALTQQAEWFVQNGLLVRRITRGTESSEAVMAENVERFLVTYFFGTDRGNGVGVSLPAGAQENGISAVPACTPNPPSVCPDYRDVFKISVDVQQRNPKKFHVAAWNNGDTRFSLDSENRILFAAREQMNPYLQNLLLMGGGGVGQAVNCPLNSYASRCRDECKAYFTGTTPWAQDWWAFGDPDSDYCKCSVRVEDNGQEIFYAAETAAGQAFIRNNSTYGFGCEAGIDWCLGYDAWRDRWHSIKNAAQGERLQACAKTFNICSQERPRPESGVSAGYFIPLPIGTWACGRCAQTAPLYGADPDPSRRGFYRFNGMLDDGSGGLKISGIGQGSSANGSYLWDWMNDPANANYLKCTNLWCSDEAVALSFSSNNRQAWQPSALHQVCRCRTRDQWLTDISDPTSVAYGGNLWDPNLSAVCDLDIATAQPWGTPLASPTRPPTQAVCPNTFDSATGMLKVQSPENPAGLTETTARLCECLRQFPQGSNLSSPSALRASFDFDFRGPEGSLAPIMQSSPYSGYPGSAWPGNNPSYYTGATFGAHSQTQAKTIDSFQVSQGTTTIPLSGGNCSAVTCEFRGNSLSCCTSPTVVNSMRDRNIPTNVSLGASTADRENYLGYCHDSCLSQYDWGREVARKLITGTQFDPVTGMWEDLPLGCGGGRVTSPGNPLTGGL